MEEKKRNRPQFQGLVFQDYQAFKQCITCGKRATKEKCASCLRKEQPKPPPKGRPTTYKKRVAID